MKKNKEFYMKKTMSNGRNWIIHYVTDQCVNSLNEYQFAFSPYICNAHSHGMREKYNHPEFQVVLDLGDRRIAFLLNRFCSMVQEGRTFESGEMVSGIIANYDLQLYEVTEENEKILRIVVPDNCNRFPEDKNCDFPYNLQYIRTEDLKAK